MTVGNYSPLRFFRKVWGRVVFLFTCFVEFSSKVVWYWTFVCWEAFDFWFNILINELVCLNFIFLPDSVLGDLHALELIHFFWVIKFVGIYLFIVVLWNPLYFCGIKYSISFISDFESSFSCWVWISVCQFFNLFKEPVLRFLLPFSLFFPSFISP